jgi:hypothetical protein
MLLREIGWDVIQARDLCMENQLALDEFTESYSYFCGRTQLRSERDNRLARLVGRRDTTPSEHTSGVTTSTSSPLLRLSGSPVSQLSIFHSDQKRTWSCQSQMMFPGGVRFLGMQEVGKKTKGMKRTTRKNVVEHSYV